MKTQIFYGAGLNAARNLSYWLECGFTAECFADIDTTKHGKTIQDIYPFVQQDGVENFPVMSLSSALELYPDSDIIVTVCASARESVKDFLIQQGISESRILFPLFDGSKLHEAFTLLNTISNSLIEHIEITQRHIVFTTKFLGRIVRIVNNAKCNTTALLKLSGNFFEQGELQIFLALLRDGDTMIDVGANIGIYSVVASLFKSNTKIYAFEPVPETYECLLETLKLNKCDVIANNCALADKQGVLQFFYNSTQPSSSSLNKANASNWVLPEIKEISVEAITLDQYVSVNKIDKIDYIKCDVEGAEKLVLDGGKESILKFKPIIQLELVDDMTKEFMYNPNDIISYLMSIGYKCYTIRYNSLFKIDEYKAKITGTDFWFVPHDKLHYLTEGKLI